MKALIAGASGIIGHGAHAALKAHGAEVKGLGRRPIEGIDTVAVDLTNTEETLHKIREQSADTTHLFYAALAAPDPGSSH